MRRTILFMGLLIPFLGRAQHDSIDWFKVGSGGGTSTAGVYQVSGTVGQPDAGGPMIGGNYSVIGGFWALHAMQSPTAPLLSIKLTGTNTAQVSWPSPSLGFNLQLSTNLAAGVWRVLRYSVNSFHKSCSQDIWLISAARELPFFSSASW